ncbi:MAG: hypothetical protein EXS64_16195 [Candidatus Latescibacteria bacterium]|nr:hypothetical protein [Candidatus Latescibacterota bacterium]
MNRRHRAPLISLLIVALAVGGLVSLAGAASIPAVTTLADSAVGSPTVGVDGRTGTVYVTWVGLADSLKTVYLSRSEKGGAFSPPTRVNDVPGDVAFHEEASAQVAVGPEGNVYVAWVNQTAVAGRRFPASDVRLARSTDGGRTFGPAVTVNDDAKGYRTTAEAGGMPASHNFHNLVVAPDGAVYVSWLDSREGGERVVLAGRALDVGGAEWTFAGASPAVAAGGGVRAVAWLDGRAVRVRLERGEGE